MTLLEVQRRMAHAILKPLTGSDRIAPKTDAAFIKPNDRLTAVERLEIYSRSYWFRVLDSLYDDFPGLRMVLGQRAFRRLSRAYLGECPSRSFTLRNLGSRLEDWLRCNPQYAGTRHALALDMVRLEWAHIEAFDNAAEKVLGPEDLLELGPRFRAALQPYIRLLALQYPVDDLRIQVNRASDERGAASNAPLKQKHHDMTKRVSLSNREQIFLAVHRREVESRPIKGTRPRGANPREDRALARELLESAKDRAELTMIVDVVRNDLGRVCDTGSVEVTSHAELMSLPTLHHTVSTVRGRLRPDAGPVELLRAAFPPASITGAPKIQAMRTIAAEEERRRGPAMGALGWISLGGDLDLAVAIRTAVASRGRVAYHAGCGIVADSDPELEFAESAAKARAFLDALGAREAG